MEQLSKTLTIGNYSPCTIQAYVREIRFILEYYPDLSPHQWKAHHIEDYILYLKQTFQSGHTKCRMVAHAVAFLFKNIFRRPYDLPSKLYPKRQFKLPPVMSPEEVKTILESVENIKHKAILELFYSTGIRLGECRHILIKDIDSKNNRIFIRQGKGRKDRFVLLAQKTLVTLREYYQEYKPKIYLFEGQTPGKAIAERSVQHILRVALTKTKLLDKGYCIHTLRHSFATHMLDNGADIHTIKELLGHSKIETTMVYLHLQNRKRASLVSPLDVLYSDKGTDTIPLQQPLL